MAERHGRKMARQVATKAGYKIGGHLGRANGGPADDAEDKAFVRSGVHQHERGMHKGETPTRLRLQDGGSSSGMTSRRGHQPARKGSGKGDGHQPKVNILIHSGGNQPNGGGMPGGPPPGPPPMPPHPPVPNMPPPPPPMARGPGGMPMGPSGMPMPVPMGAGPGGPLPPGGIGGLPPRPPGMAAGGRARRQMGGPAGMPPAMATAQPMAIPGAAGGAPAGPLPRPLGMKGGGRAKAEDHENCADGGGLGSGTHKMRFGSGSGAGRLEKIGKTVPSY